MSTMRNSVMLIASNLYEVLHVNFRVKSEREKVRTCYAAHEKNLKQARKNTAVEDDFSIGDFVLYACVMLSLFLFVAHLDFLQAF